MNAKRIVQKSGSCNELHPMSRLEGHDWNFRRSEGQKVECWHQIIMKVVHFIVLRVGPTRTKTQSVYVSRTTNKYNYLFKNFFRKNNKHITVNHSFFYLNIAIFVWAFLTVWFFTNAAHTIFSIRIVSTVLPFSSKWGIVLHVVFLVLIWCFQYLYDSFLEVNWSQACSALISKYFRDLNLKIDHLQVRRAHQKHFRCLYHQSQVYLTS